MALRLLRGESIDALSREMGVAPKEQAIQGRPFRNVEDLREAVGAIVDLYNAHWLVEKIRFVSPGRARELHGLRQVA